MTDQGQQFRQHYAQYTEEALRAILCAPRGEYETFALEAASDELRSRYAPLFTAYGGDWVPFDAVLREADYDGVEAELLHYMRPKETQPYRAVFEKIQQLAPRRDAAFELTVSQLGTDRLSASITEPGSREKLNPALLTWSEWLNVSVAKRQIMRYGEERIVAASLIYLTANGFESSGTEWLLAEMKELAQVEEEEDGEEDEEQEDDQTDDGNIMPPPGVADTSFLAQGLIDRHSATKSETVPQIRPFVRYFARGIDYCLFGAVAALVLAAVSPPLLRLLLSVKYINLIIPVWAVIEAMLLATVGTTPGKWLLRVTVTNADGVRLSFKQALGRSVTVAAVGCGLGVSYLFVVAQIISLYILIRKGKTIWDQGLSFEVVHKRIGFARGLVAIIVMIGVPVGINLFLNSFHYITLALR